MNDQTVFHILLRFKREVRGCLSILQVSAGRKNQMRYEISGSNGGIGLE